MYLGDLLLKKGKRKRGEGKQRGGRRDGNERRERNGSRRGMGSFARPLLGCFRRLCNQ